MWSLRARSLHGATAPSPEASAPRSTGLVCVCVLLQAPELCHRTKPHGLERLRSLYQAGYGLRTDAQGVATARSSDQTSLHTAPAGAVLRGLRESTAPGGAKAPGRLGMLVLGQGCVLPDVNGSCRPRGKGTALRKNKLYRQGQCPRTQQGMKRCHTGSLSRVKVTGTQVPNTETLSNLGAGVDQHVASSAAGQPRGFSASARVKFLHRAIPSCGSYWEHSRKFSASLASIH